MVASELLNSSKSFLGLFSGFLTCVPMRGDWLMRPLRDAHCTRPENSCPLARKCRFNPTVHDRGLTRIDPKKHRDTARHQTGGAHRGRPRSTRTALPAVKDQAGSVSLVVLAHDGSLNGIKRRLEVGFRSSQPVCRHCCRHLAVVLLQHANGSAHLLG